MAVTVAKPGSTLKKWLADPLMSLCSQAHVEPLLCSRHLLGATRAKTSSACHMQGGGTQIALGGLVQYCSLEKGGIRERTPGPQGLPFAKVTCDCNLFYCCFLSLNRSQGQSRFIPQRPCTITGKDKFLKIRL